MLSALAAALQNTVPVIEVLMCNSLLANTEKSAPSRRETQNGDTADKQRKFQNVKLAFFHDDLHLKLDFDAAVGTELQSGLERRAALRAGAVHSRIVLREVRTTGDAAGRAGKVVRAAHGTGVVFVAAVGAESICNGELLAAVQAEDISSRRTAVWYAVDLSAESAVILSTLIAELILILRRGLHHSGVVIIAKGARHHCRAEYSHG